MSVWKIAWRSIQHRSLGSILTILSMALGVMMVVAVLTVYGVVSEAFRNNSSIGYSLLLGARGGSLQLTLNSVYYLSRPIETIPYEYYLAFMGREQRAAELENSIQWRATAQNQRAIDLLAGWQVGPLGSGMASLLQSAAAEAGVRRNRDAMEMDARGPFATYTEYAIPILLGDYFEVPPPPGSPETGKPGKSLRVCATNQDFFTRLILDVDTEEKFRLAQGRPWESPDPECGWFGCVLGAVAARQSGLKLGDEIRVTHGVPGESGSHLHDQLFRVLGILEPTGTPHDRIVFVNMEGFYLIADHIKPIVDDSVLGTGGGGRSRAGNDGLMLASEEELQRLPLPVEQRELTSVLLATSKNDPYGTLALFLPGELEGGKLERTLAWSSFRSPTAQTSVQAINPINEIAGLFAFYVDPARWVLLGLTILICIVSGLSILVGIYNSMSQRHHEIAVMRALGASRTRVMQVILSESVLLSLAGGLLGWLMGHLLTWVLAPTMEAQTGVQTGFWKLAPGVPVGQFLFGDGKSLPGFLKFLTASVSPELLLIPGLILLAILVGMYPAISAYRTDVSRSLGK